MEDGCLPDFCYWQCDHYDVSDCLFSFLGPRISLQTVKAQEKPAPIRKDESGSAVRRIISCVGVGDLHGFRTINAGNWTKDSCQCGVVSLNAGFCRIVSIEFIYLIKEFFKAC